MDKFFSLYFVFYRLDVGLYYSPHGLHGGILLGLVAIYLYWF